jgi:N-acetylmuramoyl-L-alanine amidase
MKQKLYSATLMQNSSSSLVAAVFLLWASPLAAADKPAMLSREGWQAKPPSLSMTSQKPVAILVHHTGSAMKIKTTLAAKMRGLQRFSQAKEKLADGRTKPAWPDVPYHFYIGADGKIAEGRSITAVGDTNTGYDPSGYIQVVVEGTFDTEKPTDDQLAALQTLLGWLKQNYNVTPSAIQAHNDKAQTACPGKNLTAELKRIVSSLK